MEHSHMRGLVPQLDSTGDQASLLEQGELVCGTVIQQVRSMNHCLNCTVLFGVGSVLLLEP